MIKPSSCNGCPIEKFSKGFILSEGSGTSGVAIIGEKGGYNEYVDNLPFRPYAQGGSKLEEVFKLVSRETGQPCSREMFLIDNIIKCCPPDDLSEEYEKGAVEYCHPNVHNTLVGLHSPGNKVILGLGNTPLVALTGVSGIAKEKQSISHLRGFVFQTKYGLYVPSLHPNYVKRGKGHLTPLLVEDMKRALNVSRGLYNSHPYGEGYKKPDYQTSPSVDEAWSFYYKVKDSPRLVLTYDIETPMTGDVDEDERDELEDKEIILVQFSISKGTGIAMPFSAEYLPIIMGLFDLGNVKANHNTWNFDNPRLKAKGIRLNGKIHDTMWMFKHWHPKLPRGLQSVASLFGFPFPWKHMYSSNLQWYGCADVDAVQYLLHILPKLMKSRGVWEGYVNHVYCVHPVLERAKEIGIPVSEEKRVALEVDFKESRKEIHKELQAIIPDEIRNIRPKRKDKETGEIDYGYISDEPKIVRDCHQEYQRLCERVREIGRNAVTFETYAERKHNLTRAEFERVDDVTGERSRFIRWCIVENFKASSTQLIRYLRYKQVECNNKADSIRQERDTLYGGKNPELTQEIRDWEEMAKDYEIPISVKTKKETTSKDELEEMFLNTGDKVLEQIVRIRSYDTNINNYIPNWEPNKDGRVHTTWGFTAPQGQFDARRPNILNCSKHTEFGNEFRGIIQAPIGRVFIEFDKKSFHVGTMGYCANDKGYIRFSQIDPHSILGSYIDPSVIGSAISLKWPDSDIVEAAKAFKKECKRRGQNGVDVRQKLAKPTVLGNQLELGPKRLQNQNRQFIEYAYKRQRLSHGGEGLSAEELQAIISDLFPKVDLYKKQIKEKAHIDKYLINEFGRIQYFYDVFAFSFSRKKQQWVKKDGEGARDPIAFRVQGCAFGMITDEILEMERQGLCEEHQFVNTIHDSVIFLPEIGKLDRCIEDVLKIMRSPCLKLVNEATGPEGLRIDAEVAVGKNWKAYHKHDEYCEVPCLLKEHLDGMKEFKV